MNISRLIDTVGPASCLIAVFVAIFTFIGTSFVDRLTAEVKPPTMDQWD